MEDSVKKNMSGTKVGDESAKIQLGALSSKAFDGLDLNLSDGVQVDQAKVIEGLRKASVHQRQTLLSTKRDHNSSGLHAKGNEVQGDGMMQNSMFRFPFKDGKDTPSMGSSSSAVLALPTTQKQPLISPNIGDKSGEMNLRCVMNSASSSKLQMPINPYIPLSLNNINTKPSLKSASSSKLAMPNNSEISLSLNNINTNPRPFQTQFLFEKMLTRSDVSAINRLIIPKRIAEAYFLSPQVCENNLIKEMLEVFDSENTKWDFSLEIWQNSHSYVMSNGWKAFANRHKLKAKDVIWFYKLDLRIGGNRYKIEFEKAVIMVTKRIRVFGHDYICHFKNTDSNNGDGGGN